MATTVQLNATPREKTGKGAARKYRRDQRIPGILYGQGHDPVSLTLDEREFRRALSGRSVSAVVVDLVIEGVNAAKKTLIREVQLDPVSGNVLHVDLNEISLTEQLEVEVPIELTGTPKGVKEGGVLTHAVRTLQLKCLATQIPEVIHLDVTELMIGDSLTVADVKLDGVEILTDLDTTLAAVSVAKVHEEPTAVEEEAAAEPEVVGKEGEGEDEEKKEEEN
jgi:large subunit ribosomal protein L25